MLLACVLMYVNVAAHEQSLWPILSYPATIHDSSSSLSRACPGVKGMFKSAKLSMLAHDLVLLCRPLALLLPAVW
jgi:hypothetical protein